MRWSQSCRGISLLEKTDFEIALNSLRAMNYGRQYTQPLQTNAVQRARHLSWFIPDICHLIRRKILF
jgi:hypothetical protein